MVGSWKLGRWPGVMLTPAFVRHVVKAGLLNIPPPRAPPPAAEPPAGAPAGTPEEVADPAPPDVPDVPEAPPL